MDGPGDYHTKWSKLDRERQIPYDIAYMWNLKKWYKWTYLQNRNTHRLKERIYGYQGEKRGRARSAVWDRHVYTTIFKIDNQQGPTVQHRELGSIFCNNRNGKRIWERIDICICISESLCCTPDTNTTLLINCTPV